MKFKRGDIIKLNFNPTKGHEQGNFRPALVMNFFPLPGDLNIVLPITSKEKSYPFEVELDDRTETKGCILCFQVRTIDANKRGAYFLEKAPEDIIEQCAEYLSRLIRTDI
ncbi:MAG: type II toxin-antitoxin system PemK/MazF family toxin [Selenomonadaceae bacterium]|nr:type II toxin-antitoxin system PemK/MazF family toxin [Selenomonadaceae bacterium]